jgi:hypothetical protein
MTPSVNGDYQLGGAPTSALLVCIYTCERDRDFLGAFYESPPGRHLLQRPGARLLEVYADPDIPHSFHANNQLFLRSTESYETLCLKTLEMIRYCVRNFDFVRLLKIDVTVVRTSFQGREYKGRVPLDLTRLADFLANLPAWKHYGGFLERKEVSREKAEKWAAKKGGKIDFEKVFGSGPMPPFFSGKCYYVSRPLAEFIDKHGDVIAGEHIAYLVGAEEDVMIGRLFQQFRINARQN